ncbi:MAG: carboxypeptidase regulatory-like domain-containing protein [Crocinitomicaceae bacterium]|nr:carboxypeptidase regulatory-like domain-containing protein [Crocinitomicaceae bacterium]
MELLSLIFLTVLISSTTLAQDFSIRGIIFNKGNGEPMSDLKIRLLKSDSTSAGGAYSDIDGLFSIAKVKKGNYILQIENFGFKTIWKNIAVTKATGIKDFTFEMEKDKSVQELEGAFVSAKHKKNTTEVLISKISLDQKGLERIPSTGGENDIIAAFSITPGVVTTGDQGGQMYVRGGTPIQNKILLDGMTIYNPFHSIGFFSIFET